MATAFTITNGEGVLMFESVPYCFGDDGVDDPIVSTLARAYTSITGHRIDEGARRWILKAKERIERGETSLDMEVRRLQNRKRLSVW
ncbi:hypothetical protein N9T35_00015 [bacterium]|nr:hypothetical protein [bacterium]